mmetsp:Transcript_43992/g.116345  ORF Transcript_43992/g.116345 Transcript_43992/m.116345 type:complete len:210 (-) Transcript_43992:16-645(-)|eukprot:CAMPEP_0194540490 /NCGR_PEP_ID=MMETSP0253-20130528/80698_1 /TAXON_ID=2966 /ORGANISM="Noctiluca scintillans" /LENGTH=209 /DNA_ID=CAMNT_0039386865 /DNA_START=50 /DNA_END=676 /DNA_ORIENTATION=-
MATTARIASAAGTSEAKHVLRRTMRAQLKNLGDTELDRQSRLVFERIVRANWYMASRSIAIFMSMPNGELRTELILRHAFSEGKRVYCPRVMGDGWMEFFEVQSADEALQLPLSAWKIPEPPVDSVRADPKELDVIFVPAVAVDLARRRCGHGKGFYDRYLVRAREREGPFHAIGIVLQEQVVEEVVTGEHDELLDGVIAPEVESFEAE